MAPKIASYGSWRSPITVDAVTSGSRTLASPRVSLLSGRAFYTETKDSGNRCIVEIINDDELRDVLPAEYSAKNTVYEYGGFPFEILPDDRIIFSNKDNTVHILNPDTKAVSPLVGSPKLRYSDFDANSRDPWVAAVEEDHAHDTPAGIRNYIVAINTETAEVKRILHTADFYYTPAFSPDGSTLVWLEWDHPDLMFDSAKLYRATWKSDGTISDVHLVAGDDREGVAEPRWGPDGSLYFGKEIRGYRRLFRIRPGQDFPVEIATEGLDNAEFGGLRLYQGSRTYAPLSEKLLVAAPLVQGVSKLILINLESGAWSSLAEEDVISEIVLAALVRASDSSCLVIGSGTTTPPALYRFELEQEPRVKKLRDSVDGGLSSSLYSVPEVVRISAKDLPNRKIYGFLWMPYNPDYVAPDDELPPLIILCHGGPTAHMGSGLKLRTQYFTSRGYACFALNHTGSTGYGREYRQALFGSWGLVDSDDAVQIAQFLISEGKVKADGIGITGVSSGGYNTLETLTRHSAVFAGGVCLSGISDIKRLDDSTHKLESDYTDHLILAPGSKKEDKDRLCEERSPFCNAANITSPLLLLHGAQDFVVPLEQAQHMAEAIKENGGNVKLIVVDNEAHGFHKTENVKLWLEEEEKWWQKTLL
ncbi:hypothetical protein G7046_g4907 [Stylonectria norvegica]|nr:hypothetical protein G7046_g4907 [Stylonectria norvegica]